MAELVFDNLHLGVHVHPFMSCCTAIPAKYFLCVSGKGAVMGAGCQYLTREWFRERIGWLVEAKMLKDVYLGLYLMWL